MKKINIIKIQKIGLEYQPKYILCHDKLMKKYLIGSKLVDGGVGGCLGKMTPGEAKSPGPPGRSPFVTWDKSILTIMV